MSVRDAVIAFAHRHARIAVRVDAPAGVV